MKKIVPSLVAVIKHAELTGLILAFASCVGCFCGTAEQEKGSAKSEGNVKAPVGNKKEKPGAAFCSWDE